MNLPQYYTPTAGDVNTSPLRQKTGRWHNELVTVHTHRCEQPDRCTGLRSLTEICASYPFRPQPNVQRTTCPQALEAEMLLHGLHHGFPVLPEDKAVEAVPPYEVHNYPADAAGEAAVQESVNEELRNGAIRAVTTRPRCVSALSTKQKTDKIRIIRDCSAPARAAVNDSADALKFRMMGIQDARAAMRPFYYMAKVDVKSAFRTIGVHPSHWTLLGFKTGKPGERQQYYVDTRFPFGLKNSPEIFCRLSTAVRAMMAARGYTATVVYVDDFLIIAETQEQCHLALDALLALLADLGFTVSAKKTVHPTQTIVFLGIRLSTNVDGNGGMQISVPHDKLTKAADVARSLGSREYITRRQLQQAVGYFNHLAQAIYSARAFLRRLIYAVRDSEMAHQTRIRVTTDIRLDLRFWEYFAPRYNGQAIVMDAPAMQEGFLATDASDWGMGGFYEGRSFSVSWGTAHSIRPHRQMRAYLRRELQPDRAHPTNGRWRIEYRELYALWWALLTWGHEWRNRTVLFHNDNTTVEYTVNSMGARNPHLMRLIRQIYKLCAKENIRIRVTRITSQANILADLLSRGRPSEYLVALRDWRRHPATPAQVWTHPQFEDPPLMRQRAIRLLGEQPPHQCGMPYLQHNE